MDGIRATGNAGTQQQAKRPSEGRGGRKGVRILPDHDLGSVLTAGPERARVRREPGWSSMKTVSTLNHDTIGEPTSPNSTDGAWGDEVEYATPAGRAFPVVSAFGNRLQRLTCALAGPPMVRQRSPLAPARVYRIRATPSIGFENLSKTLES